MIVVCRVQSVFFGYVLESLRCNWNHLQNNLKIIVILLYQFFLFFVISYYISFLVGVIFIRIFFFLI